MASVGDILVYFNKSGYQHSAVITDIDGDIYICESKWGASVLCRHPHNYVPSNYADDGMVNFYVFRIEEHNWTSYTNHQTGTHTRYCGSCDYFESTTCKITYVSSGSTGHYQHCALCGFRSSTSAHTRVTKYTGDGTTHTHGEVCSDCGYVYSSAGCTTVCRYSHTEGGVNYHHSLCTVCGHETSAPSKCVYKGTSNACLACQWPKGMTGETAEIEIPEEEVQLLDPEEELQLLAPDA